MTRESSSQFVGFHEARDADITKDEAKKARITMKEYERHAKVKGIRLSISAEMRWLGVRMRNDERRFGLADTKFGEREGSCRELTDIRFDKAPYPEKALKSPKTCSLIHCNYNCLSHQRLTTNTQSNGTIYPESATTDSKANMFPYP